MNYPWFKFTVAEWLAGDIQFLSLEAQGFYINVCAMYWKKNGVLTVEQVAKRMPDAMRCACELHAEALLPRTGRIQIAWLDDQLATASSEKANRSEAAKKAADARWAKNRASECATHAQRIPERMPRSCHKDTDTDTDTDTEADTEGMHAAAPALLDPNGKDNDPFSDAPPDYDHVKSRNVADFQALFPCIRLYRDEPRIVQSMIDTHGWKLIDECGEYMRELCETSQLKDKSGAIRKVAYLSDMQSAIAYHLETEKDQKNATTK